MQRKQQTKRSGRLGGRIDRDKRISLPSSMKGKKLLAMLPDGNGRTSGKSLPETAFKLPCPIILHTA